MVFFGFWGEPDGNLGPSAPGEYQPLWPPDPDMKGVLQGISGGALQVVR